MLAHLCSLKDMNVKILLIFLGAVCIDAQRSYELCHTYGCFDSSDTQVCMTLDDNDIYYADFKNGHLVWDSRLPTSVHVGYAYSYEVNYRSACRYEVNRWKPDPSASTKTKEEPEIIIYPRDEAKTEEENTLICFIRHFFPPKINIKWTKNEIELSVEDPFIKCLPSSDGTFYVFSTLNFVPKKGDIYGCTVEHDALKEPKTVFWEVDIDELSVGPGVFCGLGLSLGLLGVAAGTFLFVKGNQYQGMLVD